MKILRCLSLCALLFGATIPTALATTVTVQSSFLGGAPAFSAGTTFTVRLEITGNTSGQIPSLAAMRIGYDTALFSFQSASGDSADGFLGDVDPFAVGAEETVSGTVVTRDIPTVGNFINTDPTPVIMNVVFEVVMTSPTPTTISVEFDPGSSAGLNSLMDQMASPIVGRTLDFTGTSSFPVPVGLSTFDVE